MKIPRNPESITYITDDGEYEGAEIDVNGEVDDTVSPTGTTGHYYDESTAKIIDSLSWIINPISPEANGSEGDKGVVPTILPDIQPDPFPTTKYKTITVKNRYFIEDYSTSALEKLYQDGGKFYVIYTDNTEDEVDWTEVVEPRVTTTSMITFDAENIGAASNQYFWDDTNGAHITDNTKDDWELEYSKTNHGVLSNPTDINPWHNILLNSLGILLRRGLLNLVSISKSAIAFYDGSGNQNGNIKAYFGSNTAQIGKDSEKHMVLSNEGITVYNGDGTIAPLNASNISAAEANITNLQTTKANVSDLNAATARITNVEADTAKIHSLTASELSAATAYINTLTTGNLTASNLIADNAKIHNITANQLAATIAYIFDLNSENITADTIIADHGDISTIINDYLKTADMEAEVARVGTLLNGYMQTNLANANVAWIQNGTIKDGSITNAMINSVSANKLTAGTIDASNITVTNLNADNITTGTINGQRIGTGSLSLDKLSEDVYTETEVNSLLSTMQTQIDGAIETWTGTVAPTLSNAPASSWNTNAKKDTHVGDVYFVVNSQSQQNGYNYRFTKTGNAYSWELIKDSDVTNALSRLTTAEGKIGTIEQFDSDISSWKTSTDSEISTIKSNHTTLAGRVTTAEGTLATKVDTSTFNTLSQTVGENTSSITSLTTRSDSIETIAKAVNLSPFYSSNLSDIYNNTTNPNGYWRTAPSNKVVQLTDGWAHITLNNESNTSAMYEYIRPNTMDISIPSKATALVEIKNFVSNYSDNTTHCWLNPSSSSYGQMYQSPITNIRLFENNNYYISLIPYSGTSNYFVHFSIGIYGGYSASFDIRISIYEGTYSGSYKPYIYNDALVDISKNANRSDSIEAIAKAVNLSPFYLSNLSDVYDSTTNPNGYWRAAPSNKVTRLKDGWAHIILDNSSGTSTLSEYIRPSRIETTLPTKATLLLEIKNLVSNYDSSNPQCFFNPRMSAYGQLYPSTTKIIDIFENANLYIPLVQYSYASSSIYFVHCAFGIYSGYSVSFDVRVSIYDDDYSGPYKPYVYGDAIVDISEVSNRVSTVSQTLDGITTRVGSVEETVLTKADGSTVTTIRNDLNTVSETVSGHTQSISTLNTTVQNKADSSTVTTLSGTVNNISDTVNGHTSQISSINQTQSTIQQSAVKSTVQLWITRSSSATPSKPTGHVVTNNSSTSNSWNLAIPTYNSTYPYYFYCYEYQYLDGSYGWSSVTRDIAAEETQSNSRSALSTANKSVKESIQLWCTKDSTTIPDKPTTAITSTSTSGNDWRVVVPIYNSSYPYYFYCWQYKLSDNTYTWSGVVYDRATTETQSTARTTSSDLANYITSNNSAIQTLQNQVDGQIEIWYKNVDPTTSNAPASTWTDNTTKSKHEGDLYYNITNGHSWRWLRSGTTSSPTYSWQQIPDSDASAALAAAQDAQTTANGKRRIFTTTPTVPYDAGDLWVNGSVIKYATTSKSSSQSYNTSDWSITATDDTAADAAQATANKNVKESVQLWFTNSTATTPTKPTTVVTSSSTSGGNWRVVVPTYNSSYPYYYYCMQYKLADGTYTWSDVVYDQATTEAQNVARTVTVNLETLQNDYANFKQTTNEFESTIGTTYVTKEDMNRLSIGGRNLLRNTKFISTNEIALTRSTIPTNGIIRLTPTTSASYAHFKINYLDYAEYGAGEYTISFDAKLADVETNYTSSNVLIYVGYQPLNRITSTFGTTNDRFTPGQTLSTDVPSTWTRLSKTIKVPDDLTNGNVDAFVEGNMLTLQFGVSGSRKPVDIRLVKMERGNRATDWTPAPEDMALDSDLISLTTRVSTNETSIQQNNQSIALKANSSDVYTKTQTDGLISTEVSNRNAAIQVATDSITSTVASTYSTISDLSDLSDRVSTNETSIQQNNNSIALKANSSDVYTKTQTDGLISTEISNRNAAIQVATDSITSTVASTYSTKTELSEGLSNIKVGGTNLLIFDTTIYGRLDTAGAAYTSSSESKTHRYSQEIAVTGNDSYTLTWYEKYVDNSTGYLYVSWFDSNHDYITRNTVGTKSSSTLVNIYNIEPYSTTFVAPSTAAFARISMPVTLNESMQIQFEHGTIATDLSLNLADAGTKPNILRGTNQNITLPDINLDGIRGFWDKSGWYVGSGSATNGSGQLISISDCPDPNQRYGFRIQATSGAKTVAQLGIPFKANTPYRLSCYTRLTPDVEQSTATFRFRIYSTSQLKASSLTLSSTDWVRFTVRFSLTNEEIIQTDIRPLIGIDGAGSIDICGIVFTEGINIRPWAASIYDYPSYDEYDIRSTSIETSISQIDDQIQLKASKIEVGNTARNLLANTISPVLGGVKTAYSTDLDPNTWYSYSSSSTLSKTTDGIRVDHIDANANGGIVIPLLGLDCLVSGETLTLSFDYKTNYSTFGTYYFLCQPTPNISQGSPGSVLNADGEWHHYERTWSYTSNSNKPWALLLSYYKVANKYLEIKDGSLILERGNMAARMKNAETSITQNSNDISLRATKTEAYQYAQPNLSPFFEMPLNDTSYWNVSGNLVTYGTTLQDGWVHLTNCSSNLNVSPNASRLKLKPSTLYTVVCEVRNATCESSISSRVYTQDNSVWSETHNVAIQSGAGSIDYKITYITGVTKATLPTTGGPHVRIFFTCNNGGVFNGDVRFSIFEGEYSEGWKPYYGTQLFASQAELKVANDSISTKVSSNGVISAINQSAEEIQIQASRVAIDGSLIINAAGEAMASLENDLSIGGRNLLRKTDRFVESDWVHYGTQVSETGELLLNHLSASTGNKYAKYIVDYLTYDNYGDGTYTVSWEAMEDLDMASGTTLKTGQYLRAYLGYQPVSGISSTFSSSRDRYKYRGAYLSTDGEWKRYSSTFVIPTDFDTGQTSALASGSVLTIEFYRAAGYAPVRVRRIKLERGDKATPWTAAPEDLGNVEITANTASTNASTAVSTANTANTNASNAVSTANTANTNASTALSTANTANTNATNAAKTATNYIVADSSGIKIASANPGTSNTYQQLTATSTDFVVNGSNELSIGISGNTPFIKIGSSNTYQKIQGTSSEIFINGTSQMRIAPDNSGYQTIRLGESGHTTMELSGMGYFELKNASYPIVHLGYGSGRNQNGGYTDSPYYTFGSRRNLNSSNRGNFSTIFGDQNEASGSSSFAAGYGCSATAVGSHAHGTLSEANGLYSWASGYESIANSTASIAMGYQLIANGDYQTVMGCLNSANTTDMFIIGGGAEEITGNTTNIVRKNIFRVNQTGTVTITGSYNTTSDRRIKTHCSYLNEDAVEFIRGLKPALYIKDGKKQLGFYAQDVQAVDSWNSSLVESVDSDSSRDFDILTLDYQALIAPLTSYTQYLETRIQELEDKICKLDKE